MEGPGRARARARALSPRRKIFSTQADDWNTPSIFNSLHKATLENFVATHLAEIEQLLVYSLKIDHVKNVKISGIKVGASIQC